MRGLWTAGLLTASLLFAGQSGATVLLQGDIPAGPSGVGAYRIGINNGPASPGTNYYLTITGGATLAKGQINATEYYNEELYSDFPVPTIISEDFFLLSGCFVSTSSPDCQSPPSVVGSPLGELSLSTNANISGNMLRLEFIEGGAPFDFCHDNPQPGRCAVWPKGTDVVMDGWVTLGSTPGHYFVSDDITDSVPEPGSWVLMIAGFAGLGVALRSRRQAFAIAA